MTEAGITGGRADLSFVEVDSEIHHKHIEFGVALRLLDRHGHGGPG